LLGAIAEGANAVTVFIIVSGFVIFFLLDSAREGYGTFIWRRVLRLYPVYLICLLASVPLQSMELAALRQAPWPHPLNPGLMDIAAASLSYLPEQLAAHLAMIHGLLPPSVLPHSPYALLGPAWSLSLEWQFYIVAPAVFWVVSKGLWPAVTLAVVTFAAYFLPGGREGMLIHHGPMFALGIASYLLWRHAARPASRFLLGIGIIVVGALTRSLPLVIWTAVFLAFYQPGAVGAGMIRATL
jgi:peptidoglycan/LPS O-acetylase OafA/YrhL